MILTAVLIVVSLVALYLLLPTIGEALFECGAAAGRDLDRVDLHDLHGSRLYPRGTRTLGIHGPPGFQGPRARVPASLGQPG